VVVGPEFETGVAGLNVWSSAAGPTCSVRHVVAQRRKMFKLIKLLKSSLLHEKY